MNGRIYLKLYLIIDHKQQKRENITQM